METAEEFFKHTTNTNFKIDAIKFAKLHVEAALKAAADNAKTEKRTRGSQYAGDWTIEVNRQSILTAYPLESIV
jgi:hypothetical protein